MIKLTLPRKQSCRCGGSFVYVKINKLPIWAESHGVLILFHMVVQIVYMLRLVEVTDIDSDLVMLLGIWTFSPKIAEQCPARGA